MSDGQITTFKGDLVAPDHMPHFVVESKFYKDFPYHRFVATGCIPLLDDWIKQTLTVVDENDFWIVAFKANRRNWAVLFPEGLRGHFALGNYIRYVGETDSYITCDLLQFMTENKDAVLRLSA